MLSFKEYLRSIDFYDDPSSDNPFIADSDDEYYAEINEMSDMLASETMNDWHRLRKLVSLHESEDSESEEGESLSDMSTDELQEMIKRIGTTYGVCVAYLGPKRMEIIANILNRNLSQCSRQPDEFKERNKEHLKKLFSKVYTMLLLKVRYTDESGRTDISLVRRNGGFTIVNLDLSKDSGETSEPLETNESITGNLKNIWASGKNVVNTIWNKLKNLGTTINAFVHGRFKGKKIDTGAIANLYACRSESIPPKSSNELKREKGVTWTRNIQIKDIKIMNNMEGDIDFTFDNDDSIKKTCSFFKALVLLSAQFGPKANEFLFEKLSTIK